jgi:hypothetical protein
MIEEGVAVCRSHSASLGHGVLNLRGTLGTHRISTLLIPLTSGL